MLTSDPEFATIAIERPGQAQSTAGTATDFDILQRAIGWLEEGVVVFGVDGRVIARNAMFLQLLGISDEEGKKLASFEDLLQAASGNAAESARFAAKWRALSSSCTEGMREELAMQSPVAQTIERYARPMIGPGGKQLGRVEVYRGRHTWQVVEARWRKRGIWCRWDCVPRPSCTN
jgi:PAS domain-containing protein